MNSQGQVAGESLTAGGERHPFFWSGSGPMVDIGTLGGTYGSATGLNDSGVVIGYAAVSGDAAEHGFVWTQSDGLSDLGTFGGSHSGAAGVNSSGMVVGYANLTGDSESHAYVWTRSGGKQDLGTLGGLYSQATAVNDSGQVVGSSSTADGSVHAFLWTAAGAMTDLGTLGSGVGTYPTDISAGGHVTGTAYVDGSGFHAFVWAPATGMVDLGFVGGGAGPWINDSGQLAGSRYPEDNQGGQTAYRGSEVGGLVGLSTSESAANGLNDAGDAAGYIQGIPDVRPTVWTNEGDTIDLGTLGGNAGSAQDLNDSGDVVGWSRTASGGQHATLWHIGAAAGDFVSRSGGRLMLDGQPFRPIGLNIYNANSNGWCANAMDGDLLDQALTDIGSGKNTIRAWFFQQLATSGGTRDWTAFDRTLATARAHGYKVIATLIDQWGNCGATNGQGYGYKDASWYQSGYTQPDPSATVSYRDWVQEVVSRYKSNSTIMAWQLVNEPEVGHCDVVPESTAVGILSSFASDVSGLIKSIDPNHLVSLGTIGGGQCGASYTDYQTVMGIPTLDLCEYHDYTPSELIPGDQFNGLQLRISQCNALGKPLLVGELGVDPRDVGGALVDRADVVDAKLCAQLSAGVAGVLLWAWNEPDPFDIVANDPVLAVLAPWSDASHTCSAPSGPRAVVAAAGDAQASVSWQPPSSNGGSVVRSYTVISSPGGLHTTVPAPRASATVTGLADGTSYTFTVTATNGAGVSVPSAVSNAVTPEAGASTPSTASGTPPAGGSVTTDPTNAGPSAAAPVTTSVTTPTGGAVTIAETTTSTLAPTGFVFGNQQVNITAPPATSAAPLQIVFSIFPQTGQRPDTTTIYRTEGGGTPTLVAPCDTGSPGRAVPDPCVASSVFDAGNTFIVVTILSSTASVWNEATPKSGAVTVTDKGFTPLLRTLSLGARLTWSFTGKKSHTVTDAQGLGPARQPLFDSGAKTTGTFTAGPFTAAGSYAYVSTVRGDAMAAAFTVPVVAVPTSGGRTSTFSIVWASTVMPGYVFDVQMRFRPAGSSKWRAWATFKNGVNTPNARFTPNQGAGTYDFTARLRNSATGRAAGWSPEALVAVS